MKPLVFACRSVALTLVFTARLALGAAGDLDPSFGAGGKVTTALGMGTDSARKVRVLSDGKILVAGRSSNGTDEDFALVRYLPDGGLDPSFNGTGFVTTDFLGDDVAGDLAVQTDGGIVVVGQAKGDQFDTSFAVARYLPTGKLDKTFARTGMVTLAGTPGVGFLDVDRSICQAIVVQADGRIILGGHVAKDLDFDLALVRLLGNGKLDDTFGFGGLVRFDLGSKDDLLTDLVQQADGKLLLAGRTGASGMTDMALMRCTSAGVLDDLFGTAGRAITAFAGASDWAGRSGGAAGWPDRRGGICQ